MHATDAAWLKRFPDLEILIDSSSLQARGRAAHFDAVLVPVPFGDFHAEPPLGRGLDGGMFPPLRERNRAGVRFPLRAGGTLRRGSTAVFL